MIVDCHCHAGTGDGLNGPWDTSAPLAAYLRRADAARIDRTVLFACFSSDYAVANRQVAEIVASDPDRFLGFAFVHPVADRGRVDALVREAVIRHGFKGIKVHRHDAPISREICEAGRAWSLPILYDLMGDAEQAELLATEYPDVRFIIPHLGSFADDWGRQRAFLDVLARHPNMHTDTSGVRRFDLLVEAVDRAGPHKVLFGSDGPWLHPGVELAKVELLGLDAVARRAVLSGNLLRLLGLDREAPATGSAPPVVPTRPPQEREVPRGDPWSTTPASAARARDA